MLEQGIIGVCLGQCNLVVVLEVEVVDAAHEGRDMLALEGFGQGTDEGRLAGALDAVEANDEGAGRGGGLVLAKSLKDEGNA